MQKNPIPTAELGQYKGFAVKRRPVAPTEAQIEEALRVLRYRAADWQPTDGPAARRDQVLLDFAGYFPGGVPIPDSAQQNAAVLLGQGRMLPGVEDQICGHCAGETFTIPVTYPENFPLKSLAGRPVEFSITLHRVMRRQMPAADDAFARTQGFADLAALRAQLTRQEQHKKEAVEERRVAAVLLAQAAAELQMHFPEGYLDEGAEQRVQTMEKDLLAAGQKPELYYRLTGHDRAWYVQRARLEIETDWRRRLAVEKIAAAEQLTVTEAEIDAELARLAGEKRPVQTLPRETVAGALRSRKVQAFLTEHAVHAD